MHAFATSWGLGDLPPDEDAWAVAQDTPYADVVEKERALDVYSDAKIRRRVRAWMRGCVLAQGGTWPDDGETCAEERDEEADEDESDESAPLSITTHTTDELQTSRQLFAAAPARNQLILDDSDSSDTTTDSEAAKDAALRSIASDEQLPRECTCYSSPSTLAHLSVSAALQVVSFEVKTVRIAHGTGGAKLSASRDALRWLLVRRFRA